MAGSGVQLMATYVQFKDGVAHAHVTTDGDLSGYGFQEVTCSGHEHLGQRWDGTQWLDAQPIRYAILDDTNTIVQINTTLYASEVQGKILDDSAISINWTFDGTKFNPPVTALDQIMAAQAASAQKEAEFWANEKAKQEAAAQEAANIPNPPAAVEAPSTTTSENPIAPTQTSTD